MRLSKHFQKTAYVLICIAGMTASVAEDSDRTNEFIEILKTYRGIGEPFGVSRADLRNILESRSFGYDIAPYVRAAATNRFQRIRADAMYMISAVEDKELVPLIVDRILHDDSKSVRSSALDNLFWFFERTPPRDLLDGETVEMLGKAAMERLSQTPEQNWYSYLKLIKYLEYSKARDFLVDLWHEKQGCNLGYILEALYAVDQGKADELLLSDNARAKFGRDVGWYSALTRSAKQNEKSLELVKNILQTVLQVERNTERKYRIPFGMAIQLALETKDEECRQWVLDIFRNSENISKKRSAILRLLKFPKSILQNEEEQNTVISAITNDKLFYDSLMKDFDKRGKGTLGRWILSLDSPLHKVSRDQD